MKPHDKQDWLTATGYAFAVTGVWLLGAWVAITVPGCAPKDTRAEVSVVGSATFVIDRR